MDNVHVCICMNNQEWMYSWYMCIMFNVHVCTHACTFFQPICSSPKNSLKRALIFYFLYTYVHVQCPRHCISVFLLKYRNKFLETNLTKMGDLGRLYNVHKKLD